MSSGGSVTVWIGQLKAGEQAALGKLHGRYWPALVAMARKKLRGAAGGAADEEDVAQAAFWSCCRGLREDRVPRLANRHDLLALLTHITACKAVNQIEHEIGAQKRGGGRVQGDSAIDILARDPTPTPLEQAILKDCYRYYLEELPDNLRSFAESYLAGFTHKEIARQLGCVERTVERKISRILETWREMATESVEASGM